VSALRDEGGNWLTPPEDCDHSTAAMRACERAIDLMAVAQDRLDVAAANHWQCAAEEFDEARRQCMHAAAQITRAHNRQQEAQGLVQCFPCGRWAPLAEMEVTETAYRSEKDPDRRPSTYYRCREGCQR
jgi:hypothetical protein